MKKFLFALILIVPFLIQTQALAKKEIYSGIEIIGDTKFINQVKTALTLIQNKAPKAFSIIKKYVGRIEEGEHSGMWAYKKPPTYELNSKTAFYSVTWCAGSIAHDSYHSKLYHEYKLAHSGAVPDDVWTGKEAEKKCIEHQIKVMQKIDAPQHEIDYLKSLNGLHYDIDKDKDYDWDDYEKRNW